MTRDERRVRARLASCRHAGARRPADRLQPHRSARGAVVAYAGAGDGEARRARAAALTGGSRVAARGGAAEGRVPRSQADVGGRVLHHPGGPGPAQARRKFSDVLRTTPGLRVSEANGQAMISSTRSAQGGGCVTVYVDGAPWQQLDPGDLDTFVQPNEVAAVEVYSGASIPAQFVTPGQSCAAVVVWTKTRVDRPQMIAHPDRSSPVRVHHRPTDAHRLRHRDDGGVRHGALGVAGGARRARRRSRRDERRHLRRARRHHHRRQGLLRDPHGTA